MREKFKQIILVYTLVFCITNYFGYTNIDWIYVAMPFWVFIFGPYIYSKIILWFLRGNK